MPMPISSSIGMTNKPRPTVTYTASEECRGLVRQAAKNAGYMWGFPHMYPAFFLMIGDHSEQVGALHSLCGLTADGLPNVLKGGAIGIVRHRTAAEPGERVGVTQ